MLDVGARRMAVGGRVRRVIYVSGAVGPDTRARGKRVTLQDLNAEMINDCFAKDGKPEIASVNRKEGQG